MTRTEFVERLARAAPGFELWFDSSPLAFDAWVEEEAGRAPEAERAGVSAGLVRLLPAEGMPVFRGVTTNPVLSAAVLKADPVYWSAWVKERSGGLRDPERLSWATYLEIVRRGAARMLPLHEESRGRWGFISGQVNPRDAADPERMVRQAHELRAVAPNVMVKVPATAAGLKVLRQLTLAGVPTNVTTQFTVSQVMACAKTVREAVEVARAKGVALDRWRSVLTLMPGRFEDLGPLDAQGTSLAGGLTEEERRWAGVAVFRRAWRLLKDGGYPSRLLLCSMRPGPGPDRCLHLEEALGDAMIVSAQPMHLKFVMDRGEAFRFRPAVEEPVPAAVLAKLQRLPYFRAAWEEGALSPQAFDAFPPVVATNRDFSKAVGEMFSFVSRAMGA